MARNSAATGSDITLPLAAAVVVNAMAGLLYIWSLFILPVERALELDRAWLGTISSLALVSFTVAVSILPRILARFGRLAAAALAAILIAGGQLVFGLAPGRTTLAAGYGLGFGAGAGLAYGLALAIAAGMPEAIRARSIGLVMAAFALSGIVLPLLLGRWIAETDPAQAFRIIGSGAALAGILCVVLLWCAPVGESEARATTAPSVPTAPALDWPFILLAIAFFAICFVGLTIVSQAAAIADARWLANPAYAATALTGGYLFGALFGAPMADAGSERRMILGLGAAVGAGVLAMLLGGQAVFLAGSALVGLAFGGAGSAFPVLIGRLYGPSHIPVLYGRMILAYGLAGLVAPWIAGLLYSASGSYDGTLGLCIALAFLAMAVAPLMRKTEAAGS